MTHLTQFFATQIGQKLHTEITTGKTYHTEVFARVYTATVLHLPSENEVVVHLTSYDRVPAGLRAAGSEQRLGDCSISITGCYGLQEFWKRVISSADPAFVDRYGANILHRI